MTTSPVPVLYLNRLEHQGKVLIKFYYKPHAGLTRQLEQTGSVKFSKQYNCFVCHYSMEQLQVIKQTFYQQAIINTRYLHRKTPTPPQITPVLPLLLPPILLPYPKKIRLNPW